MQSQSQSNARAPRSDGQVRERRQRPELRQGSPFEALTAIASRHGFVPDAAQTLWEAIVLGQGGMAQFSHPQLGGSGQWRGVLTEAEFTAKKTDLLGRL